MERGKILFVNRIDVFHESDGSFTEKCDVHGRLFDWIKKKKKIINIQFVFDGLSMIGGDGNRSFE